jgi:hypothetical protein
MTRPTITLPITGGCLCKAVRYEARAEPIVTRQCWCRLCQYVGAGSSTVNVAFETRHVTFTGGLKTFASIADSGSKLHRGFCSTCGTPMTSQAEVRPHLIFLRAGTLDDPSIVRPAMNIWTKEAPQWAHLDPDLPMVAGQPPPAA